ncbi:cupin domain [Gibbsiella quercinecans]|nr:cupin domain-containing protein [Gibbsiella quercinecans]RLM02561.1 cupin [Gibbsiella quercinecans]RLM03756.1 cupin [Gibbsiella quercinecans]TCT88984.1 cupin domain [Gibbsiella quercinecans]
MAMKFEGGAIIREAAEVMWEGLPEHIGGAISKLLVRPEVAGSKHLDYRISVYQPRAYVVPHKHDQQEQIYHILDGEGLMEIEGERSVVRRDHVIFLPPGVEHAIYNTGQTDLKLIVVTSPVEDLPVAPTDGPQSEGE